jgi:hypothetical protein
MDSHKDARLTVRSRELLARKVVEHRRPYGFQTQKAIKMAIHQAAGRLSESESAHKFR